MSSIPNSRRDFFKWLGISSLSMITVGYGMNEGVSGSSEFVRSSSLLKEKRTLFHSFLNDDVHEIVHYAFWNNKEQKDILQRSCYEMGEKLTQLKNQLIIQKKPQSADCWQILLSDGTKISFHLRYSSCQYLKGLTFFNGCKRSGMLSSGESESVLKLYQDKSCHSQYVCYKIEQNERFML